MAQKIQLKAKSRAEIGKGAVKRMRDLGAVPGIIYGSHMKPINITVGVKELEKALHSATSENVLVDLSLEEGGKTKNRLTLIQEVQHHPYKDTILHIDFHEVLATEKLRTSVPVRPVGEPAGVKTGGGVFEFVMRELHVECLPQDLPDLIEVNVEKMEIGSSIHVGEITPPNGVVLLDDKGQTVFLVAAPITEEELAAMTEAAAHSVDRARSSHGEEGRRRSRRGCRRRGEAEAGKADAKAPAAAGKADAKAPATGKAPAGGKAEAKPAGGKPEAKK